MRREADHLARYISGQEPFIKPSEDERRLHPCQRCKRPCSVRFTHCWRCAQYLKVKARLAGEQGIA